MVRETEINKVDLLDEFLKTNDVLLLKGKKEIHCDGVWVLTQIPESADRLIAEEAYLGTYLGEISLFLVFRNNDKTIICVDGMRNPQLATFIISADAKLKREPESTVEDVRDNIIQSIFGSERIKIWLPASVVNKDVRQKIKNYSAENRNFLASRSTVEEMIRQGHSRQINELKNGDWWKNI